MPWRCGRFLLPVEQRTLIMGIVNATPDSFSDGGRFFAPEAAVGHARRLAQEGADILDVGGESTRPGAKPVPAKEEMRRVVPVVEALQDLRLPISVDTRKPEVAKAALAAGASLVNDVAALRAQGMAELCAEHQCGVVLMHMQGEPRTMQQAPSYSEVVREVGDFLAERASFAEKAGMARDAIALDPGIGFGKTVDHNVQLLRGLGTIRDLGYPVLVGVSRKGFLGALSGAEKTEERLPAGLAATALAIAQGADIVRTHDVQATRAAARIADVLAGRKVAP